MRDVDIREEQKEIVAARRRPRPGTILRRDGARVVLMPDKYEWRSTSLSPTRFEVLDPHEEAKVQWLSGRVFTVRHDSTLVRVLEDNISTFRKGELCWLADEALSRMVVEKLPGARKEAS